MLLKMGHEIAMQEMKCQSPLLSALHPNEVALLPHSRFKSDSCQGDKDDKSNPSLQSFHHLKLDTGKAIGQMDEMKALLSDTGVQSSLKQEIRQLEKRLQDQFMVRCTLERALGHKPFANASSNASAMPKPTKELIEEIAVLELEVKYLEQYLLSLYRKAFEQQIAPLSSSAISKTSKWSINSSSRLSQDVARLNISSRKENEQTDSSQVTLPMKSATNPANESCVGSHSVQCSQSFLYRCSVCSARISPSAEKQARALRSCHSQPMTFTEHGKNYNSGVMISLADFLGTSIADHVPETPNRLSEEMVRCMGAIYSKLRVPSLVHRGSPASPTSSFSSRSASSPQYIGNMWSPGFRRECTCTLDAQLENPFGVEGLKEFSGPYNAMVEVSMICKDSEDLRDVEDALQKYELLVHRLETVDPRTLKNEEKLAFWINIHNALIMHAYLDHGIPQNNMKRASLLTKALYIIGGCDINASIIQNFILGCRINFPGQWLRAFLFSKLKYKNGDQWKDHAIESPEPLLYFALCSGSHSDPAVRIYSPKRLFQQLETAREEYIRATVGIRKEQKILLPKTIDAFAKDTSLSMQGVLEMVRKYLPETLQIAMQRCQREKSPKIIEWVPHNFKFRFLLSKELALPQIRQHQ